MEEIIENTKPETLEAFLVDIDEAATIADVLKTTIKVWLNKDGLIINYRPGTTGKRMRFHKEEIELARDVQWNKEAKEKLKKDIAKRKKGLEAAGIIKSPAIRAVSLTSFFLA